MNNNNNKQRDHERNHDDDTKNVSHVAEANEGGMPYAATAAVGQRATAVVPTILDNSTTSTTITTIAEKTQLKYDFENKTLMLWLFDESAETHIRDNVLDEMNAAHATDMKNKKKSSRNHLSAVCKATLKGVNKTDHKSCPIILETVTFHVFSNFLTTRKSKKGGTMLSKSSYGSSWSALLYLHKMAGYQTPVEFQQAMKEYNRNLKQTLLLAEKQQKQQQQQQKAASRPGGGESREEQGRERARARRTMNVEVHTPATTQTGEIPPHIQMRMEFQNLLKEETRTILSSFRRALDDLGIIRRPQAEEEEEDHEMKDLTQKLLHALRNQTMDGRQEDHETKNLMRKLIHALSDKTTTTTMDEDNSGTGGGNMRDNTQDEVVDDSFEGGAQQGLKLYTTKDGRFQLLPEDFTFPDMTLGSFILQWFCGDKSRSIPPYKALRPADVMGVKNGNAKLSMMKKLMFHVMKAAKIVNRVDLIVKKPFLVRDALELHHAVKHMFEFAPNNPARKPRYETMSWKTYYNLLCKRKWILMGEQVNAKRKKEIDEMDRRSRKRRMSKSNTPPPPSPAAAVPAQEAPAESNNNNNNNNDVSFAASFPTIRSATNNKCSMGRLCIIPSATGSSGLHTCYRKCGGKIHHLCANQFNLCDPDNEMNCFCCLECMNDG